MNPKEDSVEFRRNLFSNTRSVVSERERGKGSHFERLRRITGYLVGSMEYWNDGKKAEERDRVKHA